MTDHLKTTEIERNLLQSRDSLSTNAAIGILTTFLVEMFRIGYNHKKTNLQIYFKHGNNEFSTIISRNVSYIWTV